ncbi:unnamed protein product [Ectocarpus sp. 13 AM-2016]
MDVKFMMDRSMRRDVAFLRWPIPRLVCVLPAPESGAKPLEEEDIIRAVVGHPAGLVPRRQDERQGDCDAKATAVLPLPVRHEPRRVRPRRARLRGDRIAGMGKEGDAVCEGRSGPRLKCAQGER